MKHSLQVRQSQHLALTPQLQQSIRLLQLSTLELHQEVEQMLEQNPFLEAEEEAAPVFEALNDRPGPAEAERASAAADAGSDATGEGGDEGVPLDAAEFGTPERDDWENGTEREDFDGIHETPGKTRNNDADEFDDVDRDSPLPSLCDHLRAQLSSMRLGPADAAAVMVLIDSLDDDGYLADSIEEIAAKLTGHASESEGAGNAEYEEVLAQLRCGLRWLQSMEPTGVGARDLGECLTLQLRALPRSEAQMIAIIICKNHLPLLAKRDLKRLMAVTGADEEQLREAQAMIVGLEPKPGRPFARAEANVIVPDVIVQKSGRGWKVVLNPDVMPKLRINDLYANAIRKQRGNLNGAAAGLNTHLQEARWFVKNILQRFDTIQRVSQAIVERQKSFFTHGAIAMKPLVLREIADELGLHESTISRVTTAKYMATPFGTFELKYFFGSSLNTDAGGNASSTAVRALIRQIVGSESPAKPLSDSQISAMLEEQGIHVARRTVAKYREALKIAPTQLRKTM
ncbi:RNA polymerase factor sigma-54 [Piscinibacter koreensis]|uniref:RNA polymerase sigma-54 factor n=1 Tax=Piscinibacter koreensis TaxID=2742824 RepID=A0A7Y6NJZ8_9BURK|nr:RNA polymerase factor sigma-54 [Schlegelella koreensis]NUZ04557.1 RNA polymerase factor sigma-54 [Schlegelella koreensis]